VDAYLPDDVWYEIKPRLSRTEKTGHVKLADSPTGPPPIHLRGNSILPLILDGEHVNTDSLRNQSLVLVVLPGKSKTASGDLFWDDGESVNTIETGKYNYYTFKLLANCTIEIDVIKSGYDAGSSPQNIDSIDIVDTLDGDVEANTDGKPISSSAVNQGVTQLNVKINLQSKKVGEKWIINWKSTKNNLCNIK